MSSSKRLKYHYYPRALKNFSNLFCLFHFHSKYLSSRYACFIALGIKAELLRLPCQSYANFSIIKPNTALQGSVISTLLFTTDNQCESMCIMEGRCKSFNREVSGDMRCELNDKTTEDRKDNVTTVARPGWTFKSTDYDFHLVSRKKVIMNSFLGYSVVCKHWSLQIAI